MSMMKPGFFGIFQGILLNFQLISQIRDGILSLKKFFSYNFTRKYSSLNFTVFKDSIWKIRVKDRSQCAILSYVFTLKVEPV